MTHVSVGGSYKAGSPPPEGYTQWHEWAAVQHRHGLRQSYCIGCGKWRFPQEKCCGKERLTLRGFNAMVRRAERDFPVRRAPEGK